LSLKASGTIPSPDFVVTPAMRAELFRRMQSQGITVDSVTFGRAATIVDRLLGNEIARYVFGTEAEFMRRLKTDEVVAKTVGLLSGVTSQQELLDRASREARGR
jgi:hypothetical protein